LWVASPELKPAHDGSRDHRLELVRTITTALIAIVLIAAMTWIVISPSTDEVGKAALVVVASAVGFLFGRETK